MSQIELADMNTPDPSSNEREAARVALRDLLKHASDMAAAEQVVETRHQQQVAVDAKGVERAVFETQQRAKSHRDQVEQKYKEHIAQLQARHDADMKALKEHDHEVRRNALNQREKVDRDVKKEFDNAAWLAESVYDGEVQAMEKEAKEFKEKLAAEQEDLDRVEAKAAELMHIYGQEKNRVSASEEDKLTIKQGADAAWTRFRAEVDQKLHKLEFQPVARMFVGILPLVIVVVLTGGAAAAAYFTSANMEAPDLVRVAIFAGSTLAALVVVGIVSKMLANKQVRQAYAPLSQVIDAARWAGKARLANFEKLQGDRHAKAIGIKNQETQSAKEKYQPYLQRAKEQFDGTIANLQADFQKKRDTIRDRLKSQMAEADAWLKKHVDELDQKVAHDMAHHQQKNQAAVAAEEQKYAAERAKLLDDWKTGLERLANPIQAGPGQTATPLAWTDPGWDTWEPSKQFTEFVRFGELQVDVKQVIDSLPKNKPFGLPLPEAFQLPGVLSFPAHGSLMIHTDRIGRPAGLEAMQMVMTRLLTTLPPGRVKFTIIDPVGLGQNFAGFMHLADYDESLVSSRIWTDQEQIEKRLTDLTEHMETVIQKYLRNEFATIDEYNAQAGELAEPYRYLVIADFPVGFQGDMYRRLASIATSGPRCGVYLLILRDTRQTIPSGSHVDEVEAHCINLAQSGTKFVWRDEVFRQFPLSLDPAPSEDDLTKIMHIVGKGARNANRVEVPFDTIAPDNGQFWSLSSREELRVPIGRMGATRLQQLKLGKGVAQHSLIAGKTGSGKSTLLHAMITNLAMWYSPEEVEFYLIDFKKGVEFKTYGTHALPHARAIAVESDREFGLSVLQRLDAELARRGEIFRKAGVQDLPSYRLTKGAQIMPRTLLIIDEFQEFFSEDDKLAQEAGLLMDRLVRQGRAFGMHVLLGSQTIAGSAGLARSTIGQMAVRIALQCSEADSQLILGDNNSAARLLSRPGEAIYNDAGGLVEGNSPFQIAWLGDDQRERYLLKVRDAAEKKGVNLPLPIVFEGNAPAHVETNHQLAQLLANPPKPGGVPLAFLGDPVAIKNPTAISLRRQSGSNVLIVGQQDEGALGMLQTSIVSLAAGAAKDKAKFIVLDGTPADSPFAGSFNAIKDAVPHEVNLVEWRATADVINETAKEMQRRLDNDDPNAPTIYIVIYGLQRYRILRKTEDDFSFGLSNPDDGPKPPNTGKQFTELLKDGPAVGIHVLAWADTPVAVERTLDRGSMREFDHRVLFQMSANDSSNLIDSPAANKLGFYRALAFSEEQGVMEKFRPYAVASKSWLADVKQKLTNRA